MVWHTCNEINPQKVSNKKVSEYCSTHFSIKVCRTHKHTDPRLVSSPLFISQDEMIGYVSLREKMKVHEVWILCECRNNTNVHTVQELWILLVGLGTEISN